ncbi:MAG: ParB/RepB/Spo0J family partition protein [Candidatus Thiodiazotropha sp. (ex Monitilora ramsayi)]|nr:ParB/RepB/Spo0J family partition protein [Candidatus Thiodiazotropha sp. (ex Monitilora ramsayi)]
MTTNRPQPINLVTKAIDLVGISKLTKACGLASRNAIKTWEKNNGRVPIDGETDYAGIIEAETDGQVTRVDIWRQQISDLKPGIVYRVPIALLKRDKDQPRRHFDQEKLKDLANAMLADGQETPIKFTAGAPKQATPLTIKHGERRWRSAQIGEFDYLEGILDDNKEETSIERTFRQITDNMGEPLTAWDWACTFKRLHEEGHTDQHVADELLKRGINGFSRSVITNYRRLFKLPKQLQSMIEADWLKPSHGKIILLQAKHQEVIDGLIRKLRANQKDGPCPSVSMMDLTIRDIYASKFPFVDGGMNADNDFPYAINFDYETECQGCEHKHTTKLSNGHEDSFCTQPSCYLQLTEATNQALREKAQPKNSDPGEPEDDEDSEIIEPQPSTVPQLSTQPETSQPIEAAPEEPTENQKRIREMAEDQRELDRYKALVMQAIDQATDGMIDVILVYQAYVDEKIDGEDATLKKIAERMELDIQTMKKAAAKCAVDYMMKNYIKEVGNYLGVNAEEPQNNEQQSLLSEAR